MIKQRAGKGRNRANNLSIVYIGRSPTQVMIAIIVNLKIVYVFNLKVKANTVLVIIHSRFGDYGFFFSFFFY